MPHLLYLPREYDRDAGEALAPGPVPARQREIGDDLDQVRKSGLAKLAEEGQPFPFILVAPQSPEEEWFWLPATLDALLEEVSARCRVDPDRVYATGFSMGGRGTWVQAIEYPTGSRRSRRSAAASRNRKRRAGSGTYRSGPSSGEGSGPIDPEDGGGASRPPAGTRS